MVTYSFKYTTGNVVVRTFKNKEDMEWFAHNEGDHLLEVKEGFYTWATDKDSVQTKKKQKLIN